MTTPPPAPASPLRLGVRGRLAVLGGWLALGLLESAKAVVAARMAGNATSLSSVLVGNLPWWLAWAALTPLVIGMARAFRFEHGRGRPLVAHAAAAVALSLVHHVVVGTLFYFTHGRGVVLTLPRGTIEMTLGAQIRTFFEGYFLLNVLTYAATAAAYLGLDFYGRYREGELRAARLEAGMHLARLDALRMQLDPHFLFNALNAVAGLVRRADNRLAVEVISRLGELLRTTLSSGTEPEVDLRRELELLQAYLAIEEVRFGDRLTVEFEVDEAVRAAAAPPLILQPLVENAIRHGIARRPGPGSLTVSARSVQRELVLTVSDTGPGPSAPPEPTGNGVGLANVRARLHELYGDAADLTLDERPDGGTVATLRLPLRYFSVRSSASAASPGTFDSP